MALQPKDGTSEPLDIGSAAESLSGLLSDDLSTFDAEKDDATGSEGESQQDEEESTDADADAGDDEDEDSEQESEEDDEEAADDEEPEEDLYEVTLPGGQKAKKSLEELKRGYSRTEDYTRKTQALSEQRKAIEAEQAAVRTEREQYAGQLKQLGEWLESTYAEPDWEKVKQEHPDEYPAIYADWQQIEKQKAAVKAEQDRVAQLHSSEQEKQFRAYVTEQKGLLTQAIPEMADKAKAPELKRRLRDYANSVGITDDELNQTVDHRSIVMLYKAMRYDALKQKPKPVSKDKPKATLKPGSRETRDKRSTALQNARKRLGQTGHIEDGVAALMNLPNL